jgi:hypothetical protein
MTTACALQAVTCPDWSGFINEPIPDQRRLNERRRQPIADLVHLCRDGGAEIMIAAVVHHLWLTPIDPADVGS